MQDVIVQFEKFGFQYEEQAEPTLYDIDLTVRRGEKLLIVGPSGCGKSTLAHCINGLIPFSHEGEITGSLRIMGRETRDMGIFQISRVVGTVLQDSDGQFIGMTAAEDIAFAPENDCVPTDELHERVREAAALVDIDTHLSHSPAELSGGQRQRVAMAGVLVDDVDLLLFDEPLANLDPAAGKAAIELIDRLQRQTGAAVVIIEHRLEDVLHRAVDRVVLMDGGRILADTTPDELLCGDLLTSHGIREPLYLTALKYAGVPVTPDMRPASLDTLTLSEEARQKVRAWYRSLPPAPEKPAREELLAAEHLHFTYEKNREEALRDVSVTFRRGEMTAIVGRNGAGKSTFSKVVCGFETAQSGTLRFAGEDFAALNIRARAEHIGYVMQNPNHMISQTGIFDEVALGLRTRGVAEDEVRSRVEAVLTVCGLRPFRNWPVSALSYGQKKRVTIASILVLEPEILILDEPTAGQDYRHYTEIMEFLRALGARGYTVVMITHDMHLMLEYAERAVVFSEGRVIADAPCASVLTDRDLIARASLRGTSLHELALICGIPDAQAFVQRFIDYEREVVRP